MSIPLRVILLIVLWIFVVVISLYNEINGFDFNTNIITKEKKQDLVITKVENKKVDNTLFDKEVDIININNKKDEKELKSIVKDENTIEIIQEEIKTLEKNNEINKIISEEKVIIKNKKNASIILNQEKIQSEINIILKNGKIIFKRLSTDVTVKSEITIEKIAKILNKNINIKIEVAGHTDAKGEDSFNQYISLKRAKSVKKLLISFGVDALRVKAKGYGESQPIVNNDGDGYSMINRRVEFNIIKD